MTRQREEDLLHQNVGVVLNKIRPYYIVTASCATSSPLNGQREHKKIKTYILGIIRLA